MSSVTLRFYETSRPYRCFSNFSKHPIEVDGRIWATSEHFFQAAKFSDAPDVDAIWAAKTPFLAAQLGRERHRSLRPDWDEVRDEVMLMAIRAKFTQHEAIAAVLASTQGAILVEHTRNDRYWGDGGDGSGANHLGVLLERVRSDLPPWPAPFTAPPWIEHPDMERSDMFWRMGGGDSYLTTASGYYATLNGEPKAHYDAYFPAPQEWLGSW